MTLKAHIPTIDFVADVFQAGEFEQIISMIYYVAKQIFILNVFNHQLLWFFLINAFKICDCFHFYIPQIL